MKKAFVFILILTMTICSFVACDSNKSTPTEKPYEAHVDYSDINNLPENYLRVIQGNDSFILMGEEININDYNLPSIGLPLLSLDSALYGVVDMDGDGNIEILLSDAKGGDILVLHYENEAVYGYSFDFRSMYHVKSDGSFHWTASAGRKYGASRLSFIHENYCQITELYRVEHDYEDAESYNLFIADAEVTEEEYDEYIKSTSSEEITWYKLKIEAN